MLPWAATAQTSPLPLLRDRHGLPMPGSTPAPMVGSGRLGGPMGRSGGGVSARSSRPSCANVLLHADASLSTVLSVLWTGQLSRGWAVLPPGDAGRHLETSVISAGVAAGIWLVEPGEAAQDPATRRTAPPRRTASPEPPVPGAPLPALGGSPGPRGSGRAPARWGLPPSSPSPPGGATGPCDRPRDPGFRKDPHPTLAQPGSQDPSQS